MTEYSLYLESGPKRKKTMAHVLNLLGCIAQGPTTEAALEATPDAIRVYLGFLQRHGEKVDPLELFTTRVVEHVTDGNWLANGDPTPGFAPDFEPLSLRMLGIHLQRLDWMLADLLELVSDLPESQLLAQPETGRTIHHILQHIAESHGAYLRHLVGKVDGLSALLRSVEHAPPDAMPLILTELWTISQSRLRILTDDEREMLVPRGQVTWSANRCLRRMLEHAWEHAQEISQRRLNTNQELL